MPTTLMLKLAGYAVLAVLSVGIFWKVYNLAADYFNEIENTRTELANERIMRERADSSLAMLRATVQLEDEHRSAVTELKKNYEKELAQTRIETMEQIAVLKDRERLQRVTSAKPKIVENLANNATRERFNELENIINN